MKGEWRQKFMDFTQAHTHTPGEHSQSAPVALGICRFVFAEQVLKTPEEEGKQMAKTNSNSAACCSCRRFSMAYKGNTVDSGVGVGVGVCCVLKWRP